MNQDCNRENYKYYPWLFRKEVNEGENPDVFCCKYCSAYPSKAFGKEKSAWIAGWSGGTDGFREDSLKLHQNSRNHLSLKSLYITNLASQEEKLDSKKIQDTKVDAILKSRLEDWKSTLLKSQKEYLINKLKAANFVGREKMAGKKFGSV